MADFDRRFPFSDGLGRKALPFFGGELWQTSRPFYDRTSAPFNPKPSRIVRPLLASKFDGQPLALVLK